MLTVLLVVVLNKNDLNSKTTFLEDANHLSMPATSNIKIMKVLFHLSLKHCPHAEGRRSVMEDCSGLNYVHVWIEIIRKLEQRRRRRRVWRVSPRTTPGKKCFHILSAKSAIV